MSLAWIPALILYIAALSMFLVTYLPFSPMTIDIVNLRRSTQLRIFEMRNVLWLIGAGCCVALLALVFTSHDANSWLWPSVITAAILSLMYWSGYVPWVMTAPGEPRIVDADAANEILGDDDTVLGLYFEGAARAYPRDLIARPHFLPDDIGGRRLTVSYCILCNSATAFVAEINGRALDLDCVTAFNNIIYRDKASGNIIQQLDGAIIAGPDLGMVLESVPVMIATWGDWRALHPDTTISYAPPRTLRDKMVGLMLQMMIPIGRLSRRSRPWHRVQGELDERLPAMSYDWYNQDDDYRPVADPNALPIRQAFYCRDVNPVSCAERDSVRIGWS